MAEEEDTEEAEAEVRAEDAEEEETEEEVAEDAEAEVGAEEAGEVEAEQRRLRRQRIQDFPFLSTHSLSSRRRQRRPSWFECLRHSRAFGSPIAQ